MSKRTLVIVAAVAALTLGGVPAGAQAAKKKPKTPAAWTKAQKDAKTLFAVLRRAAKPADTLPHTKGKPAPSPPVVGARYLGTLSGNKAYLSLQGPNVCLTITYQSGSATGGACIPVADVKSGKRLPQALQLGVSSVSFFIAVPDGATVARTISGTATPQPVTNNAALLSTTANGTVDVTLANGKVVTARLGFAVPPPASTPAPATGY